MIESAPILFLLILLNYTQRQRVQVTLHGNVYIQLLSTTNISYLFFPKILKLNQIEKLYNQSNENIYIIESFSLSILYIFVSMSQPIQTLCLFYIFVCILNECLYILINTLIRTAFVYLFIIYIYKYNYVTFDIR